ncbi:MAG: PH domain-containing protein [Prevotella sp.]|nr:PH domain-containing protein [Prevotella sp.]
MKKTYRSKVDMWLIIVMLALTVLPLIPLLYADIPIEFFAIIVAGLCFCVAMMFSFKYVIDEKYLIVKSGFFFSQRYFIEDLRSITPTRSILSAPAASLDRLELNFGDVSVVVSPKDKAGFIECLRSKVPRNESFEEDYQESRQFGDRNGSPHTPLRK